MDVESRSSNMAAIRSKDTKPEIVVRSLIHGMGYRFRLHVKDLPGRPDLVFKSRRKVIFVHGCFWHQHKRNTCSDARLPKSNTGYWHEKLARNAERDKDHTQALKKLGWQVLTVWDCETGNSVKLQNRIARFLG
jgi:DNA mismatch endonuclease, patch repair protein